jgi:hypothetical protein
MIKKRPEISSNEIIFARMNPQEALEFTKGDPEKIKFMREVKSKIKMIDAFDNQEKPFYMQNPKTNSIENVNAKPKTNVLDYIDKMQTMYGEGKKKGGVIKDPTFTTYSNGGLAKNKKKFEKNIKVAMSETPDEETEMMLGSEALEFLKWLKEHPDSTYNDWLKDTKAELTEEQKKNPKIIDLTPFLPTFDEEIKKMEEEKKEETLNEFMKKKEKEYQTAQTMGGLRSILMV